MLKGQNSRSGVKWKYGFCQGDKHTYTFDLMRHTLTLANVQGTVQFVGSQKCRYHKIQFSF